MLTKDIQENFPFLSVVSYGGVEYIGIISNQDQYVTSMYILTDIHSDKDKQLFLELGDVWWWESNRMIPINIFLKGEFDRFRNILLTMNTKDVNVTIGPCVNLNNLTIKRVKRKNVQLVRRPKN